MTAGTAGQITVCAIVALWLAAVYLTRKKTQ